MKLDKLVRDLNKGLREINEIEVYTAKKGAHGAKLSSKLEALERVVNRLLDKIEPHENAGLCKWFHTPSGSFVTVVKTR